MLMRSILLLGAVTGLLAAASTPERRVVHEIRMTNRFLPGETTARAGDTLRFILRSGGPHNIQFFADSIADTSRALLEPAMPGDKIGPLSSPLLLDEGQVYEIAVPALAPGRYPFVCLPHYASRMLGALVVIP